MVKIEVNNGKYNSKKLIKQYFKLNSLHIGYKKVRMKEINIENTQLHESGLIVKYITKYKIVYLQGAY